MTSLEKTVTDICLRAASKVYGTKYPANLAAIAEKAADMMVNIITSQENHRALPIESTLVADTFTEWWTLNLFFDEIAKEIPIADHVEVQLADARRSDRLAYIKEEAKRGHSTTDSNRRGGPQDLAR